MIKVLFTKRFEKSFNRLAPVLKNKARNKIKLFQSNPKHPSLNSEKLKPKYLNLYSFRIDLNWRVIFDYENPRVARLRDIDKHDNIYR